MISRTRVDDRSDDATTSDAPIASDVGVIDFSVTTIYLLSIVLLALFTAIIFALSYTQHIYANVVGGVTAVSLGSDAPNFTLFALVTGSLAITQLQHLCFSARYRFDRLSILAVLPLLLLTIHYSAISSGHVRLLHNDTYHQYVNLLQYVEWAVNTSVTLLLIAHIPSTHPATHTVEVVAAAAAVVEASKSKNLQTAKKSWAIEKAEVSVREKKEDINIFGSTIDPTAPAQRGIPIYSLLQCNALTYVFAALAHVLPDAGVRMIALTGSCVTCAVTLFIINKLVLTRFVPSSATRHLRVLVLLLWCFYPAMHIACRSLDLSLSFKTEATAYFVGELLGKSMLWSAVSHIATPEGSNGKKKQ